MDPPQSSHNSSRRRRFTDRLSVRPKTSWIQPTGERSASARSTDASAFELHNSFRPAGASQLRPNEGRERDAAGASSGAVRDAFLVVHPSPRRHSGLLTLFHHLAREGENRSVEVSTTPPAQVRRSGWFRRAASTTFGRSRRFSNTTTENSTYGTENTSSNNIFVDDTWSEQSNPLNPAGGAAARAAAAAQNELYESSHTYTTRGLSRLREPKVTNDSESGIGIEIRDSAENVDTELPIIRIDPTLTLPEELMSHIMSYLDAVSLLQAELVSHRWHSTASSFHVWRDVFWNEVDASPLAHLDKSRTARVGGRGFGKDRPDQDWKKMWKVRQTLKDRWLNGQAAAIYLNGHKDSVYCVQFDEHKILTGSRDRTIRIWDAHTFECIKVLGVPKPNAPAISHAPPIVFHNRGQQPSVTIIPPQKLVEPSSTLPEIYHEGSILCLQFDETTMVTGSSDNSCIMWDVKDDYLPIRRLRHHTAGVLDVCFDSEIIVSCSKDTTICLWDRATGELIRTLTGHRGPVNAVQLRGNLIVSASGDGVAKLWNLASGLCIKEFPSKDRGMACVEFSLDARTILAGGNDQVIYQFDANTGELVRELKGHKNLVRSLHLDSANGRVISGSYDYSVKAYDLHTGDMLCDFVGWTTSWMLSAKADYRRIVATSQDSRAIVMDFGHMLPGIELLEG